VLVVKDAVLLMVLLIADVVRSVTERLGDFHVVAVVLLHATEELHTHRASKTAITKTNAKKAMA